mmetsp:Transcript_27528/g.70091  ORF Transcript_27528/g.70091 Transcript_27528/m.70091 type:complete len:225 (-) Transcript_27528:646-1320(-)
MPPGRGRAARQSASVRVRGRVRDLLPQLRGALPEVQHHRLRGRRGGGVVLRCRRRLVLHQPLLHVAVPALQQHLHQVVPRKLAGGVQPLRVRVPHLVVAVDLVVALELEHVHAPLALQPRVFPVVKDDGLAAAAQQLRVEAREEVGEGAVHARPPAVPLGQPHVQQQRDVRGRHARVNEVLLGRVVADAHLRHVGQRGDHDRDAAPAQLVRVVGQQVVQPLLYE